MAQEIRIEVEAEGEGRSFCVSAEGRICRYRLRCAGQQDYLDFYERLSRDFGTRMPRNREAALPPTFKAPYRPLLTENIGRGIRYGYGDPAVLRAGGHYYLYVTSNDARDAFPILRSADLEDWEHVGFAFPQGRMPVWTAQGPLVSDFWAPEVQWIGGRNLLCFSARGKDGSLAIGLAEASGPEGPFTPMAEPLLRGGVIDAHIFPSRDGPLLYWKEDSNAIWPRLLGQMLYEEPSLASSLFGTEPDRRTAAAAAALWPWIEAAEPMEQFFALQPLIEAAVADFAGIRRRLMALGTPAAEAALQATRTPIFAQRLSPDGLGLSGERHIVLVNDLDWEGHLIEGPWLSEQQGRYYLFYAGNDFSTAEYGIGAAVSETPFGPFKKMARPLLRSTASWSGPGHPSLAPGLDGTPNLFFHAFRPGQAGYKQFRALLCARLAFHADGVELLG